MDTSFIKNALHVRSNENIAMYGISNTFLAKDLSKDASVHGIALNKQEFEAAKGSCTKTFRGLGGLDHKKFYKRVFCDFSRLPYDFRDMGRCLNACHSICEDRGLVLISNVLNRNHVMKFVSQKHVQNYWLLRENDSSCDFLYVKKSYIDE